MDRAAARSPNRVSARYPCRLRLGYDRSTLWLVRYLAARHQYSTTIVTFLMVFVIQNTQNRDTTALHLKLDELIRVN